MKKVYLFIMFMCLFSFSKAQDYQQFTPYEELNTSQKMLKPYYSDDLPDWAKMLYQYPVNLKDIDREFNLWEQQEKQRTGENKIKNPLVRYYKIWRKTLQQYVLADGTIVLPQKIKDNSLKSAKTKLAIQKNSSANWTFLGPKETFWLKTKKEISKAVPWQVNIFTFDVASSDNNILYAGTETGFVNKTVDGGKHWMQCGLDYNFGGSISALAIHPTNPDIVYVSAGKYMYKTEDGGSSWIQISNSTYNLNKIIINPNNPDIIHVGGERGIFISKDAGNTWSEKYSGNVWDIEFKADDSNIIYAIVSKKNRNMMIVESIDGGNNYKNMTGFPTNILGQGALIAVTPANVNSMYAIILGSQVPFLYKGTRNETTNSWTWVKKHEGVQGGSGSERLVIGQGFFDLVLEVSPEDENIVYTGTLTLFKSTNSGKNMRPVGGYKGKFKIHPDIQAMKFLTNGRVWVSTDGGMNYSTDNFTEIKNHFALNDGLIGSDFWGFDQGWNEDICVGGRYHNGNTAIADFYNDKALRLGGAEEATGWVIQGKSRHVVFSDLGNGMILPKTLKKELEGRFAFTKHQKYGGHHPNMDGFGESRSNLYTHPYYSGTIYSGSGNGIWISKDFGATFELLYDFGSTVRYFIGSAINPNVMYADIQPKSIPKDEKDKGKQKNNTGGFYRSEDGGKTWEKRTSPIDWDGQMTFVISPYNDNVVYASCQYVPSYSGKSGVYKTTDGGKTWIKWSSDIVTGKSLVIQPTNDHKDLVYAFSTSNDNGYKAEVFMRKDGDANWSKFDTGYPAGMIVNIALPFYRDGKIRVAGNAGVWETSFEESAFEPIVRPWVEKEKYLSVTDTVRFDCHSILNHSGATWKWSFSPEPKYIDNPNKRNPKVIFPKEGEYKVTLEVTQNGKTFTKTIDKMVKIGFIDDCSNPNVLPKSKMKLIKVDSYHHGNEGQKAFDDNPLTIWHTSWGYQEPYPPHYIIIDLGEEYNVSGMIYTTRSDGDNGNIKGYKLYISNNSTEWKNPVSVGEMPNETGTNTIEFNRTLGRYVKLVATSEIKGRPWTSIAELSFKGCREKTGISDIKTYTLNAFPIPANDIINIPIPNGSDEFDYFVFSLKGQQLDNGHIKADKDYLSINVNHYSKGYYLVVLRAKNGTMFNVKFIK